MHQASRTVVARENQFSAGGPSACTVIVAEVLERVIRGGQDAITMAVLDECVRSVRSWLPCGSLFHLCQAVLFVCRAYKHIARMST
jgi:hypothetical protein